ncbi:MAG: M14 family metallopeptidase [Marinoscillum sp.]
MANWLKIKTAFLSTIIIACSAVKELPSFQYSDPFDTTTKPVAEMVKRTFTDDSVVFASNEFDGARLTSFERINDSSFLVTILPENEPINPSPWYALKLWSTTSQGICLYFDYGSFKHRYYPKISSDGTIWANLDSARIVTDSAGRFDYLKIDLNLEDTLWLAGQDVINSKQTTMWAKQFAGKNNLYFNVIGQSRLGRDLIMIDSDPKNQEKKIIAILSRQHPPEVTGFMAMQYFLEEMFNSENSEAFLKKYRVLIFPLMNPDGIDLGYWRHSAGGVDLNRDWADYNQPEVRNVAEYIYHQSNGERVILGIDFHSTYRDVFYTNDTLSEYTYVKEYWFDYMEANIPNYEVNEKISPITKPVSKSWFYVAFGAEGVTYEVGDNTPDELIELKGRSSARGILQSLTK